MIELLLVGIGTGNPDHLTLQAIKALNSADLILIPRKGEAKEDLADLRRSICADVVTNPATRFAEFDLPVRDPLIADYHARVEAWHDAIAGVWTETIPAEIGTAGRVALLVWGDPSLYDSTLRIAQRVSRTLPLSVHVVAGITSLQVLTAAHAIPLNEVGEPFIVTTGRQLRDHGWPLGVDTVAVMLDGDCSFHAIASDGVAIWWGAYLGMENELLIAGPLSEVSDRIVAAREKARARYGWIMDIYILRRA